MIVLKFQFLSPISVSWFWNEIWNIPEFFNLPKCPYIVFISSTCPWLTLLNQLNGHFHPLFLNHFYYLSSYWSILLFQVWPGAVHRNTGTIGALGEINNNLKIFQIFSHSFSYYEISDGYKKEKITMHSWFIQETFYFMS